MPGLTDQPLWRLLLGPQRLPITCRWPISRASGSSHLLQPPQQPPAAQLPHLHTALPLARCPAPSAASLSAAVAAVQLHCVSQPAAPQPLPSWLPVRYCAGRPARPSGYARQPCSCALLPRPAAAAAGAAVTGLLPVQRWRRPGLRQQCMCAGRGSASHMPRLPAYALHHQHVDKWTCLRFRATQCADHPPVTAPETRCACCFRPV